MSKVEIYTGDGAEEEIYIDNKRICNVTHWTISRGEDDQPVLTITCLPDEVRISLQAAEEEDNMIDALFRTLDPQEIEDEALSDLEWGGPSAVKVAIDLVRRRLGGTELEAHPEGG